jgi:hypothetical protein
MLRLSAFVTVAVGLCFPAIADAADLVKQFQSEYAAAWNRIVAVYSKIELTEEVSFPGRVGEKPTTIKYMGDGERFRMDFENPEGDVWVTVATATSSFNLEKRSGQSVFEVKDLNRHAFRHERAAIRRRGYLVSAPYCIMDLQLIDFMADPEFERVGFEVISAEGSDRLKMRWRSPYLVEGKPETRVGWFLFIPGSWVLSEYEFRYTENALGALRARIEYDGVYDGIPLVKSMERWTEHRDGPPQPDMTSRIVHLSTTPPASESFTLAAFNLPNDLGEAVKPQTSRLWMILLGLSGLAVSWLLAAWIRKRHSASAS